MGKVGTLQYLYSRLAIAEKAMHKGQSHERNQKSSLRPPRLLTRNVRFNQQQETVRKKLKSTSILKKISTYDTSPDFKNRPSSHSFRYHKKVSLNHSLDQTQTNQTIEADYLKIYRQATAKKNFEDSTFPPVTSSLFPIAVKHKQITGFHLKWMRIGEIFKGRELVLWNPMTLSGNISAGSQLCPAYLVQAFNAIRSHRAIFKQIFESQVFTLKGVYFLKLFHNAAWKPIIIDDYIPVQVITRGAQSFFQPIFTVGANTNKNKTEPVQIWSYLLEKAFAKIYSSYESICGGNLFDFLTEVTGYDSLYKCALSKEHDFKEIFSLPDIIALGERINGEEHSKKLVPIMPAKGFDKKISFYITSESDRLLHRITIWPEDVGSFFTGVYIWGWEQYENWQSSKVHQHKHRVIVRRFSLKTTSKCCISLYQKDRQYYPKKSLYDYSWMRMILLLKEFNGGYRWIAGDYSQEKGLNINGRLEQGQYLILVLPDWKDKKAADFHIALRTNTPTALEKIAYQEGTFEQGCADLAQRYGNLNQLSKYLCSYNCILEEMGLIIQNINNEKTKGNLRIRRTLTSIKADLPIEPFNQQFNQRGVLQFAIEPETSYTVVLMMKGGIDRNFFEKFNFGAK